MTNILLITHAIAGLVTLIAGIGAMVSPKRLKVHRPFGKIFYYTMWYVVVTAFALSLLKTNYFLFMVGILVFYTNVMGFRSLQLYKSKVISVGWKEWGVWAFTVVLLVGVHIYIIVHSGFQTDGVFMIINIFTLILTLNLLQDAKLFRAKSIERKRYLIAHIGKMGGTFIAAVTAALVQNVVTNPLWVGWLLPAAIFTPAIVFYIKQVRKGSFWQKRRIIN
ncbi:hypothetical protein JKA74_05410 [Marivirga sp. S37H4]|uniref:DUF2306 domain-containing protein n=1 Tax=Marivirga aurantiaca TaxID=2802615 RepID=A0A934WWZ3_9BACT|nr:hypothetical protein [Marivirga aurantiaca]MBK6264467.1 hypothetical protein [Marivirga aurantiaca]